jgi:hypothetical protein
MKIAWSLRSFHAIFTPIRFAERAAQVKRMLDGRLRRKGIKKYMTIIEEVHLLYDVIQFINRIINNDIFDLLGEDDDKQITFKTSYNYYYFYINVLDIIKHNREKESILDKLTKCSNFGLDKSMVLVNEVSKFSYWLNNEIEDNIYFHSFEKELKINICRYNLIYLYANYLKHTVSNLTYVRTELLKLLKTQISIENDKNIFFIKTFFEYFSENILLYHSSMIAQYINDIRWAIHDYLINEYNKSIWYKDKMKYEYRIPKQIDSEIDKYVYWELMNETRDGPYIQRFKITEYLTKRY